MATTYGPQPAAPVMMAFGGPAPQRRLTVFFRLILLIPQAIVLFFVGIAAVVVVVIGWFGALFMGRLPDFAADFLPGVLRWQARVQAYEFLLTDRYPPFTLEPDDSYPVWLTARPGPLNRLAVLFRLILVIPAWVIAGVVQYGAFTVVAVVTWFIVLIRGSMPQSLYEAYAAGLRYQIRLGGYLLMITSEWPWGLFGDSETSGTFGQPPYGAPPAYGAPPTYAPPAYGAPPTYGAAPTYGAPPSYGAPPAPTAAPGSFGAPTEPPPTSAPPPAAPQPSAPEPAAGPTAPVVPGVAITFGGPSYLWGYTDDRSHCGIWSATDLSAPPQTWPIGEQGEAWTRFWQLEPNAVEFSEPTAPPPAAPWAPGVAPTPGATTSRYAAGAPTIGAPYPSGAPAYPASASAYPTDVPPYGAAGSPYPTTGSGGYESGGTPTEDPRWRLVLSQGARRLMVFFIVLGIVVGIVFQVVAQSSTVKNAIARAQVQSAYDNLNSSVISFENQTNACRGSAQVLSCVTTADRTVAQAFGTFVSTLEVTPIPSAATADAETLINDGTTTERVFENLAASTSATQYEQAVQAANISDVLTRFTQDYNRLHSDLS